MINIGRYYEINPETALIRTNHKFVQRFQFVEQQVKESNREWGGTFSLAELDRFWEQAKQFDR
ncbi:possible tetrapyrrole methyltransferase domain [Gracilibacillus boraciitolerans JCM 21714]|uniref:Possible tetrapyrrole methyltransferase domain n=1 Tax=Gracilibacillus boraciitolerans JCM 21714 TaxID=1298598 RepID=W4VMX4_9BACI|nr:possible tetrapyrrole methyltransferase domain [Gracilibacillus boraciitolerans JCM 21714]